MLVPYELIQAAHYSATAAGAALLPFPLVMSVASPALGAFAGKVGARIPLIGGSLIVGAGFLLAMRIGPGGGYWTTVLPAILVMSVGMAGVAAPLTTAVLASVDSRHTGSASGFNSAVARTGGLIATALLGAVPLALGSGSGSELRRPLGITIIGGLLISQLLTLYTTPVIYIWFDRLAARLSRRPDAKRVQLGSEPVSAD